MSVCVCVVGSDGGVRGDGRGALFNSDVGVSKDGCVVDYCLAVI